jgi:tetratricopeptide (TPR) repeat protein
MLWLLEDGFHLQTWAVSVWLSEESAQAAARSAAEALELARLGLRAAELMKGDAALTAAVKGHAWAFLGNAHRVDGNLVTSDTAFVTARAFWQERTDTCTGVLAEWRIDDLEASLRRDQRQWGAALDLLDRARAAAPLEVAGRILINKATVLEQAGEFEASLAVLDEADRLVDVESKPRLGWLVRFNQTICLCHLERFDEAEIRLRRVSEVAVQLDNGLDLLLVLWLRGRVAAGQGRRKEARDALYRVRAEFMATRNGLQTALVSLELAILALEEGRTFEVRELVRSMVGIFKSQRIDREAAAALRLFCEAAEAETVTLEQVRRLHASLEAAHSSFRGTSERSLRGGDDANEGP